jgi:hypothetical protein
MTLSVPGAAGGLFPGQGGVLLVAGLRQRPSPVPDGFPVVDAVFLTRLDSSGRELGTQVYEFPTVRSRGLLGATQASDGSVTVVGTDPGLFATRFTATGALDRSFGTLGTMRWPTSHLTDIHSVAIDRRGRLLLAGSFDNGKTNGPRLFRADPTRSTPPVRVALTRTPVADVTGFRTVQVEHRGRILLLSASGDTLLRLRPDGRPDLTFGVGGVSPIPRGAATEAGGILLTRRSAYLLGGRADEDKGPLTIERVHLAGRGTVPPRAQKQVTVAALKGPVLLGVPLAAAAQRLHRRAAAPLADGGRPSRVDATAGIVRVTGTAGSARIRHARFTLRPTRRGIAALPLARADCGARAKTDIALSGRFVLRVGSKAIRNRTRRAALTIQRPCHGPLPIITARRGRLAVNGRP